MSLAGLSAEQIRSDPRAAAAKLPGVDSIDMAGFLLNGTAESASPRTEIPLDCNFHGECALISGNFKLLQGAVTNAAWSGPVSPNASTGPMAPVFKRYTAQCGDGCLYDIVADPGEHFDLASSPQHGATLRALQARARALNASTFRPDRGGHDFAAECNAAAKAGNFFAPWLDATDTVPDNI